MLSLLQKKSRKVFIYTIFNTQSKCIKKKQEFAAPKDIMGFGAKFLVSPTGSRHLRMMKTITKDDN